MDKNSLKFYCVETAIPTMSEIIDMSTPNQEILNNFLLVHGMSENPERIVVKKKSIKGISFSGFFVGSLVNGKKIILEKKEGEIIRIAFLD